MWIQTLLHKIAELLWRWKKQETEFQGDWSKQAEDDVEVEPGVFISRKGYERYHQQQQENQQQENRSNNFAEEEQLDDEEEPQSQDEEQSQEEIDPYNQYKVIQTNQHERLQRWWIKTAAFLGAPVIWGVATYGVGQWLTGFQGFSLAVLPWYFVAGVYEFMGIALLFVGAREIVKNNAGKAFLALTGAVFIALSTFFAQFLLLYSESARDLLFIPGAALQALPVDKSAILIFRAAIPSVIELYLVFLVSERKPDVHATIAERRKLSQEIAMLEEEDTTARQTKVARQAVTMLLEGATSILEQQMSQLKEGQDIIRTEIHPKTFVHRVHDTQYLGESSESVVEKRQPPKSSSAIIPTEKKQVELSLDVENLASHETSSKNGHNVQAIESGIGALKFQDDTILLETEKTALQSSQSSTNGKASVHTDSNFKLQEQTAILQEKPIEAIKIVEKKPVEKQQAEEVPPKQRATPMDISSLFKKL